MRLIIWAAGLAVASIVIYDSAVLLLAALRSNAVSEASQAYRSPDTGGEATKHLLVIGDSTSVGTGAGTPRCSVAGRLADDFPQLAVIHRGENGALTREVLDQLSKEPRQHFDLILIQTGGNDVLRLTGSETLENQVSDLLSAARQRADHIVLMSVGNLGQAPAIPWPLSRLYSWRARVVRDIFSDAARARGVPYVDLFAGAGEQSPFQDNPQRYYARDGLHPSGAGYGVWYEKLRSTQPIAAWLAPARSGTEPLQENDGRATGHCPA